MQLQKDIVAYYQSNPDYFDFDLQKYRMRTQKKIGASLKSSLPIGIGIAVFTLIGNPIAVVPITMGIVSGSMNIKKHIVNRDTKRVLKGAYLYLETDHDIKKHKAKKYRASFDKFHKKISKKYDVNSKEQLALKLLYINHFASLIAKRLQNDPKIATYKNFYKKNKVPGNGSWNQKFMLEYFILLDHALLDIAKRNSFHQLNQIKNGIISHEN